MPKKKGAIVSASIEDDFEKCIETEVFRKNALVGDLQKLEAKLAQLEHGEAQTRKSTRPVESLKKNIALTKSSLDTVKATIADLEARKIQASMPVQMSSPGSSVSRLTPLSDEELPRADLNHGHIKPVAAPKNRGQTKGTTTTGGKRSAKGKAKEKAKEKHVAPVTAPSTQDVGQTKITAKGKGKAKEKQDVRMEVPGNSDQEQNRTCDVDVSTANGEARAPAIQRIHSRSSQDGKQAGTHSLSHSQAPAPVLTSSGSSKRKRTHEENTKAEWHGIQQADSVTLERPPSVRVSSKNGHKTAQSAGSHSQPQGATTQRRAVDAPRQVSPTPSRTPTPPPPPKKRARKVLPELPSSDSEPQDPPANFTAPKAAVENTTRQNLRARTGPGQGSRRVLNGDTPRKPQSQASTGGTKSTKLPARPNKEDDVEIAPPLKKKAQKQILGLEDEDVEMEDVEMSSSEEEPPARSRYEEDDEIEDLAEEDGHGGDGEENKKKGKEKVKEFLLYRNMEPQEQARWNKKGMAAIRRIDSGRKHCFPRNILAMIKKDQMFLPQAARTSKRVSLAVLRSNRGNYCCLFHSRRNKSGNLKNTLTPVWRRGRSKYRIVGVYEHRRFVKRKDKKALAQQPRGILNCGCKQAHAIWELYIWKTWRVVEAIGKDWIMESLEEDILEPRIRLFATDALRRTGLRMVDFLRGSKSKLEAKTDATLERILWLVNRYNKMVSMDKKNRSRYAKVVHAVWEDVKKDVGDLDVSDSETGSILRWDSEEELEVHHDDSSDSDDY